MYYEYREKLNGGFTTFTITLRLEKSLLRRCSCFQQAALAFLVRAVDYGLYNLPLKEALLKHAPFVDAQQRAECGVEDALYFVDRFQELLPLHEPQEEESPMPLFSSILKVVGS